MRTLSVIAFAILLSSCESKPSPPAPTPVPKVVSTPKPADESRRFPKMNQIDTIVVDKELLGKPFMPGGTLAQYRKGKTEYDMFLAKAATSTDAALILPDWEHALTDTKFIPSFGGYFGRDQGRPVFVFTKGVWIAGIAGLNERDADTEARKLAKALD
jgi:hypothetical protein